MFEVAYVENGRVMRGGIKAPLETAEQWARENAENEPFKHWVVVKASPDALTKEELYEQLDKMFERRHEK